MTQPAQIQYYITYYNNFMSSKNMKYDQVRFGSFWYTKPITLVRFGLVLDKLKQFSSGDGLVF